MSNRTEDTRSDRPDRTYVERREEKSGGNVGLALIVGGLVVAVGVLVWALYGGEAPVDAPVGNDIDVSVEGVADDAAGTAENTDDAAGDPAAADDTGDAAPEPDNN